MGEFLQECRWYGAYAGAVVLIALLLLSAWLMYDAAKRQCGVLFYVDLGIHFVVLTVMVLLYHQGEYSWVPPLKSVVLVVTAIAAGNRGIRGAGYLAMSGMVMFVASIIMLVDYNNPGLFGW